ncbi:hypothetical protein A3Q56_05103 [Intoshia linei]|uniref:Uncharacterized protein n=1 Tax=Intoshia linei TaxID=1819745 RepID=A0A177B157_9BILA|nr:hypothetical protein A3Q56_05103 [Intoshia linei]
MSVLAQKWFFICIAWPFSIRSLKGEFGYIRQKAESNYYIAVEQVLLNIQDLDTIDPYSNSSCIIETTLEDCLKIDNKLSDTQNSILFFVSGYITFKEKLLEMNITEHDISRD